MPIPISEPERIWVEEIYRHYKAQEPIDPLQILIKLKDRLPKTFKTSDVNPKLVHGNKITALGVHAVDPNSELLCDTESVINSIREMLIKHPGDRTFTAAQIGERLGLSEAYTEDLFYLMTTSGSFFSQASNTSSGRGYTSITVNGEDSLQEFLNFKTLEQKLQAKENEYSADSKEFYSPNLKNLNDRQEEKEQDLHMNNSWNKNWAKICDLGAGGQGQVFLVGHNDDPQIKKLNEIITFSEELVSEERMSPRRSIFSEKIKIVRKNIIELFNKGIPCIKNDESKYGALKELHDRANARDYDNSLERLKREIDAARKIKHPNVIEILEHNLDEKWLITKFYPRGSLSVNHDLFFGKVLESLIAFKSLVEAIVKFQKIELMHRDIKPDNIFIDSDDSLILGDLGLVFFEDNRISKIYENVGSRDWMPLWAQGSKIEDFEPQFDLFSLGKVLWSMISGKTILKAHYFKNKKQPKYNLENMFSDHPEIKWATEIISATVVEHKEDALSDANEYLALVDNAINQIKSSYDKKIFYKSDLDKLFEIKTKDSCKELDDGFWALGQKKFDNSIIEYRNEHQSLTAVAHFKANVENNKHKYWRYGITVRPKDNSNKFTFHLSNENTVVVMKDDNYILRYPSDISFSNRYVKLKVTISKEKDLRIISCYLDDTFIYQHSDDSIQKNTITISVWSDKERDHDVRITNIIVIPFGE